MILKLLRRRRKRSKAVCVNATAFVKATESECFTAISRCPRFKKCRAPLCPLDPNLPLRRWVVGEPICRNREFSQIEWILAQKSLAKKRSKGVYAVRGGKLVRLGP